MAELTRRELALGLAGGAVGAQETWTLDSLWRGFDSRALPLEIEIASEEKLDGLVLRKLYYTSEIAQGFKVRIVAWYGFPPSARNEPAILHIHGGGQTATRQYVEYWARRGYAALSINWGGYPLAANRPAEGNTDWGPINANQRDTTNTYRVRPDPRVNSWYHWLIACRRALTLLERQPEADAARLGVFGVSMGGRLTWMLAGLDGRVRAACSVYGAVSMSEPLPGLPGSEQVRFAAEDLPVWRATLETDAYVPSIRCPFLFLGAADDFYGAVDFVDRAIGRIPHANRWQSYTPHYNHHVEPEQAAALPLFMDRWLRGGQAWPATPALRAGSDAVVSPEQAQTVRRVDVYYSVDPYPQSRFWRSAATVRKGRRWIARLPDRGRLWVYAQVLYASGLSLSTRLAAVPARARTAAEPIELLIDDFSRGETDWFVPLSPPNLLISERRASPWRIATRKTGDPKWRGPAGAVLAIRARAPFAGTLLVTATENEFRRPRPRRIYTARAQFDGRDVRLPLTAFRAAEGDGTLTSWENVNLLTIETQGPPPALERIEWLPATVV